MTRAIACMFWLVAAALTAPAATIAQEPAEAHKRPEAGDKLPDVVVVDDATGARTSLLAALVAAPGDAPLVIAFLHKDKDLCVRFVKELQEQVEAIGDARLRCAIHLVFSGEERDGAAIAAAKQLAAPFRLQWDPDRSAYRTMGLIAFPTVYVVERKTGTIAVLRRGYKVSLAQEVAARLKLGLGLMTADQFARLDGPSEEVPAAVKQRRTRLREAQQLLQSGKAETALKLFDSVLAEDPQDRAARAGHAIAASKLGREDAYELLVAASKEQPADPALGLALGGWLLDHNRLDEAEPLLRAVLERDPAPAYFALGRLHELRGNWKEAALAYREAATRLLH